MEFNEKVMDHFINPRNVGEINDANGIGEAGSLECGDYLRIYLKVNDEEMIEDIKFKVHGCVAAIASSSALTEIAKGMNIYEAMLIRDMDIVDYLDGLPKEKIHCSVMGAECMESAVQNYMVNKGYILESDTK